MKFTISTTALCLLLVMAGNPIKAHMLEAEEHHPQHEKRTHETKHENNLNHGNVIKLAEKEIVPEDERKQAIERKFSGPKETKGVKGVRRLGSVPLKGQFTDIENRKLRAREIDIEPGGVVAVHRHDQRPGVAYIVSGELTEHRQGEKTPLVKKAGDTAFEQTGVTHWWINEGKTVARVIVVDLVPNEIE